MLIEGYRVQIRQANWYLGLKDITDEEGFRWYTIHKTAISCAKKLSQAIGYEWKKEYKEER